MKKIISLILVAFMFCSMLTGCFYQDEDTRMKAAYLFQFRIWDKSPEDVILEYDAGTFNGARVVMLDASWNEAEAVKYTLTENSYIQYYDTNRLLVFKYGIFFSLYTALELSILSDEDILNITQGFNESVNHFVDLCDKYDFESGEIQLDPYHPFVDGDAIVVKFDSKMISGGKMEDYQELVDYVNDTLGYELLRKIGLQAFKDSDGTAYKVSINNDNPEKIPSILQEMLTVPGILVVTPYSREYYPYI